jgi:hypothetical protein
MEDNILEILDVKYEARIPCQGRSNIEHAWLEGTLQGTDIWVIHICEFRNGKYTSEATYLRPDELEKLRTKINDLKQE